jgi:hypothetical protein
VAGFAASFAGGAGAAAGGCAGVAGACTAGGTSFGGCACASMNTKEGATSTADRVTFNKKFAFFILVRA